MASLSRGGRSFLWRCRLRRWGTELAIMLLAQTPFAVLFMWAFTRPSGLPKTLWPKLGLYAIALAGGLATSWAGRRLRRRARYLVQRHRWRVCLQCGYALTPEQDGHSCPECGSPVHLAECERVWRRFFDAVY